MSNGYTFLRFSIVSMVWRNEWKVFSGPQPTDALNLENQVAKGPPALFRAETGAMGKSRW